MLKGFKEFLARGNIIDLSIAVVIGTAFNALVTKFTDSIITPLIGRIGAGKQSSVGIFRIGIGGGQAIDLNIFVSAAINFVLVAAVVYFFVVVPFNALRRRGAAAVTADVQPERGTEVELLTEIRDLLIESGGSSSGRHVTVSDAAAEPD